MKKFNSCRFPLNAFTWQFSEGYKEVIVVGQLIYYNKVKLRYKNKTHSPILTLLNLIRSQSQ